jgi:acetyl-CoA synthetase
VVSLGNAAVIECGRAPHVARAIGDRDRTGPIRAVALYWRTTATAPDWRAALADCARADVRVAVLKAGRSAAGRRGAGRHTAALAGDQRVFAALIEEAGGVLVRIRTNCWRPPAPWPSGRRHGGRLAVLTASGGDAAIAADLAADAGVTAGRAGTGHPGPAGRAAAAHRRRDEPARPTQPVWADTGAIAGLTAALAVDPEVGPVIYVQDEPPGLPPVDAAEWAATRAGAELGGRRAGIETMLVATTPGQEPPGAIGGLRPALAAISARRRPTPDPARLTAIAGRPLRIPAPPPHRQLAGRTRSQGRPLRRGHPRPTAHRHPAPVGG